jgi:hypothetical protein
VRAEDPEGVERGNIAIEWGSDALVELLSRLDLRHVAASIPSAPSGFGVDPAYPSVAATGGRNA